MDLFETALLQRPVLRYHGGKWLLAPWIISHFPPHKIYVEPFGGAGSVLLRKPRTFCEVYNDLDEEVVNLFRVLRCREEALKLCDLLSLTPFGRVDFKEAYQISDEPLERARRLVVRSFLGFGSAAHNIRYSTGFRAASKETGRPHSMDWVNLPECLWIVTERLKGVTIENRAALEVIQQQDHPQALFYLDPEYLPSTRPNSNCKQYQHRMSIRDHEELGELLGAIKGRAIISGYWSKLYERIYRDWNVVQRVAQASGQKGRIQRMEILWKNF